METLAAAHRLEQELKKSRFIAIAAPAASRDEALAFVEAVRQPDATHNCWAYRIGQEYRFSDDGEPGGTAGQPILRAIDGQGLDHVVVVVTRYFGGVKLGAGGLVRAYGGTAAGCLREAPRLVVRPMVTVMLVAPFEAVGAVYPVLSQHGATKKAERYTDAGFELEVELEQDRLAGFEQAVRDATRGRGSVTPA